MGAYSKVPKGRQRYKQIDIKQVMYSVALSGLSFVNALVPGANTPVCGLSRLDFVDLWFGAFPPDTKSLFCGFMLVVTVCAGEQGQPNDSTTYGV